MKTRFLLVLVLARFAVFACTSTAGQIRFEGIFGNSGVDGDTLVRYGPIDSAQDGNFSGLAYDRLGHLWTFGGRNRLVQLTVDGRMTAAFPLVMKNNERLSLVLAGDTLVLKIGEKLFRLPINAANGQVPEPLTATARAISLNSVNGTIAIIDPLRGVGVLNLADGSVKPLGTVEATGRADSIVLLPDGGALVDGTVKLRDGQPPEKVKKAVPGVQFMDGHLYSFSWHMTVTRYNLDLESDPGVVYGGSAGDFIGSLPEDSEMQMPRGIAHIGGNRYAIVSMLGVVHVIVWDTDKQAFEGVRRLGTTHFPAMLALSNTGATWCYSGYWDWSDGPDHLPRSPIGIARSNPNAQAVVQPGGQVAFPIVSNGRSELVGRPFDEEKKNLSSEVAQLPKDPTGVAVFPPDKGSSELIVVNQKGTGVHVLTDVNGRLRRILGECSLKFTSATPDVTSLAALDNGDLLAADGGFLVRLKRAGDNFQEVSRTNQIAGASVFGARIYLATSGNQLWVSDTANNRVLHATLAGEQMLTPTVFTGGPCATPLSAPQRISAAGARAVVIDWNNQRIVKMSYAP